jgi:hypothetical protein
MWGCVLNSSAPIQNPVDTCFKHGNEFSCSVRFRLILDGVERPSASEFTYLLRGLSPQANYTDRETAACHYGT